MYIDNHFQNTMYISTQSNQPKHEKPYKGIDINKL